MNGFGAPRASRSAQFVAMCLRRSTLSKGVMTRKAVFRRLPSLQALGLSPRFGSRTAQTFRSVFCLTFRLFP